MSAKHVSNSNDPLNNTNVFVSGLSPLFFELICNQHFVCQPYPVSVRKGGLKGYEGLTNLIPGDGGLHPTLPVSVRKGGLKVMKG
jgi:hypothetical protein